MRQPEVIDGDKSWLCQLLLFCKRDLTNLVYSLFFSVMVVNGQFSYDSVCNPIK